MIQLAEEQDQRAIDTYHRLIYSLHEDEYAHWMGVLIRKTPLDLWIYAELIHRVQPDVIIETGTGKGGSALFFSAMQRMVKPEGTVVTIDEKPCPDSIARHDGIVHHEGQSQDPNTKTIVEGRVDEGDVVMVSLDAGHLTHEVLVELEWYAPLVTPGSYCVVEDTNIEGNPIGHEGVNGPGKAVKEYLRWHHDEFEADELCERFKLTFNPGGWLRRR